MSAYDTLMERLARTRAGSWLFMRVATQLDRRIVRWTRGAVSSGLGTPFHRNCVLLATTGAKTGRQRTVPLLATRSGDDLVVIASNGGAPEHPAWYRNLQKTPRCRVMCDGAWRERVAREVEGDERERLWRLAVQNYAGYGDYEKRAERRIPVMLLEPAT
jgi:deazaflavin-dependent oxidoreductase (nitroreductase family)